jgi:hypothetical protein
MPAQVSSEEVAIAKGDGGVQAVHASREVKRVNAENWKALPAWRKLLVIVASGIIFAGCGWLKFAVLTSDVLSALAVVVLGFTLLFKLGAKRDGDD